MAFTCLLFYKHKLLWDPVNSSRASCMLIQPKVDGCIAGKDACVSFIFLIPAGLHWRVQDAKLSCARFCSGTALIRGVRLRYDDPPIGEQKDFIWWHETTNTGCIQTVSVLNNWHTSRAAKLLCSRHKCAHIHTHPHTRTHCRKCFLKLNNGDQLWGFIAKVSWETMRLCGFF